MIKLERFPKNKRTKNLTLFYRNHQQLKKDLRAGIIKYILTPCSRNRFARSCTKVISLKLPEWFEKGLIEYLTEGWSKRSIRINRKNGNKKISKSSHQNILNSLVNPFGIF